MHRGGIAVGQLRCCQLVVLEDLFPPVVHPRHQTLGLGVDQEHHAALGGHHLAVCSRSEGHDPVPGRVAGTTGSSQLRARHSSLSCHLVPRQPVEFCDIGPAPGEHRCVSALAHVGRPRLDHGGQRDVAGRGGDHPAGGGVELDRTPDVAGAQLGQGFPFGLVVLADVLVESVNGTPVALDECAQRPANPDRSQLAVVTHQDHLGPGHPGLVQQE
jgi:hypothetical protein